MIKKIMRFLGKCLSYFFNHNIKNKLSSSFRNFYTGYQSRYFKTFGENSILNLSTNIIGHEFISIGKNVSIGRRCTLTAIRKNDFSPNIFICDNVSIGDNCHITSINRVTISSNVLLGESVTITDNSHGENKYLNELKIHPSLRNVFSKGETLIEENVWIGDKATILPGVTIGAGSIVGANAVVTKDVIPYSIVAGNPAEVIRIIE